MHRIIPSLVAGALLLTGSAAPADPPSTTAAFELYDDIVDRAVQRTPGQDTGAEEFGIDLTPVVAAAIAAADSRYTYAVADGLFAIDVQVAAVAQPEDLACLSVSMLEPDYVAVTHMVIRGACQPLDDDASAGDGP